MEVITMSNKFKLKKKLVSIALALVLAAQPLASLPMNVFAGTDKNNLIMAPRIEKKTVSVPVPTTFTVPLTYRYTYNTSNGDILGATTGGISFSAAPVYADMGEKVDNCPKNMKELKKLVSWEAKASGTFVTADTK